MLGKHPWCPTFTPGCWGRQLDFHSKEGSSHVLQPSNALGWSSHVVSVLTFELTLALVKHDTVEGNLQQMTHFCAVYVQFYFWCQRSPWNFCSCSLLAPRDSYLWWRRGAVPCRERWTSQAPRPSRKLPQWKRTKKHILGFFTPVICVHNILCNSCTHTDVQFDWVISFNRHGMTQKCMNIYKHTGFKWIWDYLGLDDAV